MDRGFEIPFAPAKRLQTSGPLCVRTQLSRLKAPPTRRAPQPAEHADVLSSVSPFTVENPVTTMSWGQSRSDRLMSLKKICCVNQITTRSDDLADNDQSGQSLKLNCAVHHRDCGTLSRGSRHANRHRSGPDKREGYAFDGGSLKAGFPARVRRSSHRRCLKRRLKDGDL
jgi:hypothetical protein